MPLAAYFTSGLSSFSGHLEVRHNNDRITQHIAESAALPLGFCQRIFLPPLTSSFCETEELIRCGIVPDDQRCLGDKVRSSLRVFIPNLLVFEMTDALQIVTKLKSKPSECPPANLGLFREQCRPRCDFTPCSKQMPNETASDCGQKRRNRQLECSPRYLGSITHIFDWLISTPDGCTVVALCVINAAGHPRQTADAEDEMAIVEALRSDRGLGRAFMHRGMYF